MLSKAKSLVRNHWKKAVYGGVAFQVVSYGFKYAARRVIKGHQEKAKEMWLQMKKHEHFEKTNANAVSTYLSLLPLLRDKINTCLNSETLTASLKDKSTTNKLAIWDELKCIAFSRMLSSIYASSILNILLHIQLSVMGGYLIQESCSRKGNNNSEEEESIFGGGSDGQGTTATIIDEALQQEYLSLSDYFIKEGVEDLCALIYEKTKGIIGPMALTRKLTVNDLEQTTWHIIESLKNDITTVDDVDDFVLLGNDSASNPIKNSWKFIFPPTVLNQYDNFRRVYQSPPMGPESMNGGNGLVDMRELILTDTFDLLQSQDVEYLMTSFETFGVSSFLDQLVDILAATTTPPQNNNNISASSSSSSSDIRIGGSTSTSPIGNDSSSTSNSINPTTSYILPHEVSIPLAKLIPLINNFFPNNLQPSNPWITSTTQAEKLRDFSANVYESFSTPFPL